LGRWKIRLSDLEVNDFLPLGFKGLGFYQDLECCFSSQPTQALCEFQSVLL